MKGLRKAIAVLVMIEDFTIIPNTSETKSGLNLWTKMLSVHYANDAQPNTSAMFSRQHTKIITPIKLMLMLSSVDRALK